MSEKKNNPTVFQMKVYDACRKIPRGTVTTYKALGHAIGCASARAIGQALRRNPYAPEVPCHRVVASDLSIGGFNGHRAGSEIQRKIRLLREEGVTISPDQRVRESCVFRFV